MAQVQKKVVEQIDNASGLRLIATYNTADKKITVKDEHNRDLSLEGMTLQQFDDFRASLALISTKATAEFV
jgi:hypothetical protein